MMRTNGSSRVQDNSPLDQHMRHFSMEQFILNQVNLSGVLWVPRKCKFFLWLVAHNRCWTADRLARLGLPHPEHCSFCDQEDETIQYILCTCVFSQQFWHQLLRRFGLPDLAPQSTSGPRLGFMTGGNKRVACSTRKLGGDLTRWL